MRLKPLIPLGRSLTVGGGIKPFGFVPMGYFSRVHVLYSCGSCTHRKYKIYRYCPPLNGDKTDLVLAFVGAIHGPYCKHGINNDLASRLTQPLELEQRVVSAPYLL